MLTGERIRNTREDLDMRQQELADAIGINVSVLSRIEKGTRQIRDDELLKIAKKLNVSTDYLLGNEYFKNQDGTPWSPWKDGFPNSSIPTAHSKKDTADLAKFLDKTEVMFDGDTYHLDDEGKQKLRNALEFVFWDAKKQNKRKKD